MHRTLFICAPQVREMELRRFLASFTRLETVVSDSVALPLSRADYDAVADDIPLMRCLVNTPAFQAGSARLACDFRVNPFLDSLLAQADSYGYRLSYHVNIRVIEIDREWIRAAGKNVLEVRDLPGVPRSIVMMQQRLTDQLLQATALCEEYLAVDPGPAVWWLRETLGHNFRQQFEAFRFEAKSWDFIEGGYEEELASAAFTTSDQLLVDELCAGAIRDSQVATFLGWRPSDNLADRFSDRVQVDPLEVDDFSALPASLPLAYTGNEPYIFVSYKRADLDRVSPVMAYLQERGYRLWYDRGIKGGDDWTAVLEERLASSCGLLLFISQASIDSKYVRREVLFADSMEKRIISIRLESVQLRHGMKLLLPRYQIIDHGVADFTVQLVRALKNAR
jgi:hypothetical protein